MAIYALYVARKLDAKSEVLRRDLHNAECNADGYEKLTEYHRAKSSARLGEIAALKMMLAKSNAATWAKVDELMPRIVEGE